MAIDDGQYGRRHWDTLSSWLAQYVAERPAEPATLEAVL
jgi:hypothetical protein